jgi:hypothetical protein
MVRQLLAKAQRAGSRWGEPQWAALWQELEAAHRAVPALLELDELLDEYCRCVGGWMLAAGWAGWAGMWMLAGGWWHCIFGGAQIPRVHNLGEVLN